MWTAALKNRKEDQEEEAGEANEISLDAAIEAVLSRLGGIFHIERVTLKHRWRLFPQRKSRISLSPRLALARVHLNTAVHRSLVTHD